VCVLGPRFNEAIGNSLGYFPPRRASSQFFLRRRAPADLSSTCPLFANEVCIAWLKRGCNTVGCVNTNGHRSTNSRSSFSAPEAVLSEVEQRFDCAEAQTHLLSEFGGGFSPPILNRIPLLQVRSQTHSTDWMLSPIEKLRA